MPVNNIDHLVSISLVYEHVLICYSTYFKFLKQFSKALLKSHHEASFEAGILVGTLSENQLGRNNSIAAHMKDFNLLCSGKRKLTCWYVKLFRLHAVSM